MTTTEEFGLPLAVLGIRTIRIPHTAPIVKGAVPCFGLLVITAGFALAGADYLLGD